MIKNSLSTGDKHFSPESCRVARDPELASRWHLIENFVIDDPTAETPFSHILAAEMGWTNEFTDLAIREYKRFIFLSILHEDEMTPSFHVDTIWHLHMLYSRNYHQFCRETLNRDYLHHEPSKGGSSEKVQLKNFYAETLTRYEDTFGCPAPTSIWGAKS